MATLDFIHQTKYIGTYGAHACYRFVIINRSGSATANIGLTVEPVHIDSVAPSSVSQNGGDSITVSGRGFGVQQLGSSLMVGPAIINSTKITSWTDTSITFTLPSMTGTTGAQSVIVYPEVGREVELRDGDPVLNRRGGLITHRDGPGRARQRRLRDRVRHDRQGAGLPAGVQSPR